MGFAIYLIFLIFAVIMMIVCCAVVSLCVYLIEKAARRYIIGSEDSENG